MGDQYQDTSIKSGARERRKKKKNPIRKWLCNGDVPLPFDWGGYLALQDNKTELSNFLMEQVLETVTDNMIVISGPFEDPEEVRSTLPRRHCRFESKS